MSIDELLATAVNAGASDLHLTVGTAPTIRVNGALHKLNEDKLLPPDTAALVKEVMRPSSQETLEAEGQADFSYGLAGLGRFRVNVYRQRDAYALAFRVIPARVQTLEELGMPTVLHDLSERPNGLIIVTGPTGSGKSTTLAAMVDSINSTQTRHIVTIEDPIEYLHSHKQSIVNQREVGSDTQSFAGALRSALRQDPDVILVGEMRDLETISTSLTAAETGHLVLATLHTNDAAQTVNRIIDVFPAHQQQQIRVQLADVIQGIVAQQLVPTKDGRGRVAALEVMVVTPAIRNLIREGKTHQIRSAIQTGGRMNMQTMDKSLHDLYRRGLISLEEATKRATSPEEFQRLMGRF